MMFYACYPLLDMECNKHLHLFKSCARVIEDKQENCNKTAVFGGISHAAELM